MSTLARTAVIDSDAHVIETERTWEYLREEDETHRPLVLTRKDEATDQQFWFLEGRAWGKNVNQGDEFPTAAREAADIKARLRHMDELGVDMHVLFPTMFLRPSRATRTLTTPCPVPTTGGSVISGPRGRVGSVGQ